MAWWVPLWPALKGAIGVHSTACWRAEYSSATFGGERQRHDAKNPQVGIPRHPAVGPRLWGNGLRECGQQLSLLAR